MAVKEAGPARASARERLLAAANELFYNEGVHTVGIDRVIEQAGVAKASLYNTFGSKDELIRAYLESRHAGMERRFGKAHRVWVMDRGMVSAQNVAWLNATGRRYVIGTARAELKRWSKQIAENDDWRRDP